MSKVTYGLYRLAAGDGPNYLCRPLVDEKERLIFTGATAETAESAARAWIEKNVLARPAPKKREEAAPDADVFG